MVTLLFVSYFLANAVSSGSAKGCSLTLKDRGKIGTLLNSLIAGVLASLFFFLLGGHPIPEKPEIFLYALLFTAICMGSQISGLFIYRYLSVTATTVGSNAANVILLFLIGVFFYRETVDLFDILRLPLLLLSLLLFLFGQREKGANAEGHKFRIRGIALLSFRVLIGCASTLLCRRFSKNVGEAYSNDFFLITNLMIVFFCLIWFLWLRRTKKDGKTNVSLRAVGFFPLLLIAVNTVSSNVASLLSVQLLSRVDVAIYSPISSAFSILCAVLISFLFREKLSLCTKLSVIPALIAVFL